MAALSNKIKHHLLAFISELVGTFLFLFFAYGGTNAVNSPPKNPETDNLAADPSKLLFISLAFGISLAVNAWVFFRVSGGLFNPAVTVALMLVGGASIIRGALMIVAQLIGAIAAAAVVSALFPGPLNVATTLVEGTSIARGLFIEMFLTAQLIITIFMLAAEKHRATFVAPIGIGLSLLIIEMVGVYYTGGSVNPARSFGPCVVNASFTGYHWIYWLGPILGSILASAFYLLLKALNYQTLNPDQDHDGVEGRRFDTVSTDTEQMHTTNDRTPTDPDKLASLAYERGPAAEAGL
ncbi:hypothetical protein DV736_g4365, partial [Chaetothyriales sp. CBS 134916]